MALTPVAPTLLNLTSNGFQIDVNADGNPGTTFYSFRVTFGSETKFIDGAGQLSDTEVRLNVTTLTLSNGLPNTLHAVSLSASDNGTGLNQSAFGPASNGITLAADPIAKLFIAVFSTTVTADWDANENPTGTEYEVQLSPDPTFLTGIITSGFVTTVGHIFTNLVPSTTYHGRVKARNSAFVETSFVSLGSTLTNQGPDTVKIIRVRDLIAERGFLIDWQFNLETDIAGYNVFRSSSPTDNAEFKKLNSTLIAANVNSHIDNIPFTFGVVFYYKVTAVDDGGNESSLTLTSPVHDNTFHSFEEQPFLNAVTDNDFISDEVPQGAIDGFNALFTTQFSYRTDSVKVFQDGIRLRRGIDFNEGPLSQQITLTFAPNIGAGLRVEYIRFGSGV